MLPIGYAAFIGLGLAATVLGVAWPFIRASFDLPLEAVGAVLVAFTLGHLTSSLVCALLMLALHVAWAR